MLIEMRHLSLLLAALLSLLLAAACFNSDQSNDGVAQINDSTQVSPQDDISRTITDESELNDEQRATQYTECLRDLGYSIKDPELNADGTINFMALRTSISQTINLSDSDTKDRNSLESCSPLLDGITRGRRSVQEDETKLKDDMLKFAQCLREKGFNVKDPVFNSDNLRAAMRPMIQNLTGPKVKINASVNECNALVFETTVPRRDR